MAEESIREKIMAALDKLSDEQAIRVLKFIQTLINEGDPVTDDNDEDPLAGFINK
jgi:hypothetical protein